MRVLLGVTGGIAAYKVALVLRQLRADGHSVQVIPTAASLNFVGRATWEALSGHPAPTETFEDVPSVAHVRLGQQADIVLVAPATADFLASMAHGNAKDLLGNAILATQAPVVLAPAMHTEMWLNAATQANVATLRDRGVTVIDPAVGRLTGADSGPGRLPEPEALVEALYEVAAGRAIPFSRAQATDGLTDEAGWGDLAGVNVLISAGGTHEPVDAVRFLGNRSSGHQGVALAQAAFDRGAHVTLIAANVVLPAGEGIVRVDVETSAQLADAVKTAATHADVVIMAAAVADFRPRQVRDTKIKKDGGAGLTLELEPTEDILAALVATRPQGQTVVGFAAETGDETGTVLEHGAAKARRKGAGLLVLNPVGAGQGFGDVPNSVTMLDVNGHVMGEAAGTKLVVAHAVLDRIVAMRTV
jgi:phosphopantothenoylcysteine decarboxylase/phosphopantothenate--cysteine ligase